MTDNKPNLLKIREFLSSDKYVIPIYQRNYDWGEREAVQLIEDVADYASESPDKTYYIGSAVVFPKHEDGDVVFEMIDGQQRLTTLTILVSLLKPDWWRRPNLAYAHRSDANSALLELTNDNPANHPAARNIGDVRAILAKNLPRILAEKGLTQSQFDRYLFDQVVILRIPVPEDTELNHYFEIMNTRGEQLEKHEVLKANLMSHLDCQEQPLFNAIWEACSDMSAYVQMNFTVALRNALLSDQWNELRYSDFNGLNDAFRAATNRAVGNADADADSEETAQPRSIDALLGDAANNVAYPLPSDDSQKEGRQDRFGSIINFPNFLLHVLKIVYHTLASGCQQEVDALIKLDDKRLIQVFKAVVKSLGDDDAKRAFVKLYIVELLRLRMMFDRYVIKREYVNGNESWSLKQLKRYNGNRANYINTLTGSGSEEEDELGKDIRMLQAMFHVSAPTQIYKHWLNAVLYYVYCQHRRNGGVNPPEMRTTLYRLATAYMLDIYLTTEKTDFEAIIYHNGFAATNIQIDWSLLGKGCDVPNFVFNFYDYITWRNDQQQASPRFPRFEFSYRTSVEHFYPRHPMPGYDSLPDADLNSFGNLCLISRSTNSKFSNNMPKAKLENFGLLPEVRNGLSLKLLEMMDAVQGGGEWGTQQIAAFDAMAKQRILDAIRLKAPQACAKPADSSLSDPQLALL